MKIKHVLTSLALAAASLASMTSVASDRPAVQGPCLALGAGGANGLAHITVLEVLDAQGTRPSRIAGSSIGAVVGALYASGLSGAQIRELVLDSFTAGEDRSLGELLSEDAVRWAALIEVELGEGGLLGSDGIMTFLLESLRARTFEELSLPLMVVAGDLWTREQVVLEHGDLSSAVRASMALPGVFQPVVREGRTLIDGGTVNPVPFDLFGEECGFVIAVDVVGERTPPANGEVGYFDTVFNSAKVMQQAIVTAKRRLREPDLYLAPAITDVRALEFYRAQEVFDQSQPLRERLTRELQGRSRR